MTATQEGRFLIRIQGFISELDFKSDQEKDEFLESLGNSMFERMRQFLLTWRANKRIRDSEPKPDPPPVPDHIRRERERTAAKRSRY